MRLENYINEKMKFQYSVVKNILEKGLDELYDVFNKDDFNLDAKRIVDILTLIYQDSGIEFYVPKTGGTKKVSKYVHGATYYSENGKVILAISPLIKKAVLKYKNGKRDDEFFDINRNEFMKYIHTTITHEFTHKEQFNRDKRVDIYDEVPEDYEEYLALPIEIEAHAQEAATELMKNGSSEIPDQYKMYFDIGHPARKRFFKKLYQYFRKKIK